VKGDATSLAIAAASVVAKTARDAHMRRLDLATGGKWAFADHAGYITELHSSRIQLHGISVHHRRSYAAKAYDGAVVAPMEPLGATRGVPVM
jgi:ribonuclease HII